MTHVRKNINCKDIMNALPVAILVVSANGTVLMSNKSSEAMFGNMVGRNVDEIVPEMFRAGHKGLRTSFAEQPRVYIMGSRRDILAVDKHGKEIHVEVALSTVRENGDKYVVAAIADITKSIRQRNELEEVNRRLRARIEQADELSRQMSLIDDTIDQIKKGIGKSS